MANIIAFRAFGLAFGIYGINIEEWLHTCSVISSESSEVVYLDFIIAFSIVTMETFYRTVSLFACADFDEVGTDRSNACVPIGDAPKTVFNNPFRKNGPGMQCTPTDLTGGCAHQSMSVLSPSL